MVVEQLRSSNLKLYKEVNLILLSYPNWKIKFYNDNFTESPYAEKIITYKENLITANVLEEKERYIRICGVGNSMTPILKSKQVVIVSSFKEDLLTIARGSIVFCKVNGHFYLHKVYGIRDGQYLIGNNHGHENGWTNKVYGKVIKII